MISGGKLPMTWYPQDYVQKVAMTDMNMRANMSNGYPGRTYRFYMGPVIYPFGHGLSYTKFSHSLANAPTQLSVPLDGQKLASVNSTDPVRTKRAVRVTHTRCDGLHIPVHVNVKNEGDRDGTHTVMIYSNPPAGHSAPVKQLVGFEKVHVAAGGQVKVEMAVDVCNDLSFADINGVRRIPIGEHNLRIGELTHSVSLVAEQTKL